MYLYGWPIEQVLRHAIGSSATWWQVFGLALPLSALAAYASWNLVEGRALRLAKVNWGERMMRGRAARGLYRSG